MKVKEFKLLSAIFAFALVAGLIFMFDSHNTENAHSDIVYIDEYEVVTEMDIMEPDDETPVPDEQYAERTHMDQLMEMIGFIK
ncbi:MULTISPECIES: hypothetical protein [Salinicoccus]|uniref:Uncharacterized protein n=1 Tax=Salinicoccus roseus TaxID=45670 RepID=A0A265EA34_9STAP|nr:MULTISPECIES: hypothetical protein [Salinicoccus]MBY8910373.1 hypothetical protein [Salinicoccus roseus]MCC4721985.1 hypothetical protein [Salinicoccus sp. RF5]OZT78296.1 hypothetical protein CFN03_03185 [Salinicoccus roseus]RPE54379.1 hypothetical protein EDC33_0634 [Salinicoccus roseus]GGA65954.1 hypothetical protein GCM10007176_08040 [Salinicoccus roseus]